jgi:hypothetical protein
MPPTFLYRIRAGIIVTSVYNDPDGGLRAMFAELRFPAPVWLLVAHAHSWGADAACVDRLNHLPVKDYQQLDEVLDALKQQKRSAGRRGERTAQQ